MQPNRLEVRKVRAIALVATLTMVLAACGGGGGGSAGAEARLLIWVGSGASGEETKKLGAAFGQEHGANVTVQVIPGEELQTQFVTASQAGRAPDVVMGAHDWIGNLVQNGTIDPVQLTEDAQADFQPLAVKAMTFNGQIYGVPFTMNNVVLFRNTELAPEAPQTIEDMVAKGKELKASGKVSEIFGMPIGPYHSHALYTSAGGYMFGTLPNGDFNPKDLGVAKPEAGQAYQKIGALGEKGEGAIRRSITGENTLGLFTGKKTAFMMDGPWNFAQLKKTDLKYDVSPVPPFAGGKPAKPFITVDGAYVASKGKNKVLAQEFVTNYWSRPEVALALFKANPAVPALKAALETAQAK